jgi:hypothetical protein
MLVQTDKIKCNVTVYCCLRNTCIAVGVQLFLVDGALLSILYSSLFALSVILSSSVIALWCFGSYSNTEIQIY